MLQRLPISPEMRMEQLKTALIAKFPSPAIAIDPEDKKKIAESMNAVKYPYAVEDFLVYIDQATAKLMSESAHPILKEYGNKFVAFYVDDQNKKYVEPLTGLVVLSQTKIKARGPNFEGNGSWRISNNAWVPSPGSTDSNNGQYLNLYFKTLLTRGGIWFLKGRREPSDYPPFNPPLLSQKPFALLSPIHVAVGLLGDETLSKTLINGHGARLDDDCNEWHITPLELAIQCEQLEILKFIFENNITKNIDKAINLAVEKGSFTLIEKLFDYAAITDEVLDIARNRDRALHHYLEIKRASNLNQLIHHQGPLKALKTLLNYTVIPQQTVVDLLCQCPNVIHDPDVGGNTLLHCLVIEKSVDKFKKLMAAILAAKMIQREVVFDIEKKTNSLPAKTVTQLAFDSNDKELISAVILYGNPDTTDFVTQIRDLSINLSLISTQRTEMFRSMEEKKSQTQNVINEIVMQTNQDVATLAAQQERMATQLSAQVMLNTFFMQFIQAQSNTINYLNDKVIRLEQQLAQAGIVPPPARVAPPALPSIQSMLALPGIAGNTHLLFAAPPANNQTLPDNQQLNQGRRLNF